MVDMEKYEKLPSRCLYETKEMFGSNPSDQIYDYKTDASLLIPDSFTESLWLEATDESTLT